MDFDEIEGLSEEQLLELYDEIIEIGVTGYARFIDCRNGRRGCVDVSDGRWVRVSCNRTSSCWYDSAGSGEAVICGPNFGGATTCVGN